MLILAISISGCSLFLKKDSLQQEAISKPIPKGITTITININRAQYQEYLQRGESINKARFVPVFSRGSATTEFRLFDVKQGSIFELIGLESLDIIVAASGYQVPGGNVFWAYLNMLSGMDEGTVEIRRNGIPLLIKIKLFK